MARSAGSWLLIAVASIGAAACETPPDPRRTNFEIRGKEGVAKYDPATGRLKRIDADTNKNGKLETFSFWDGSRVIRIEIDGDEDGKIDRWEHYADANKIARIGSSSRDDQVEDTWTYPNEDGLLGRVEFDTDRDGVIDKREIYTASVTEPNGRVLSVVELELDKAGTPRRRLYYGSGGKFERSEIVR